MYYIRLFSNLSLLTSRYHGGGYIVAYSRVMKSDPMYQLVELLPTIISRKAYSGSSGATLDGYLYQNSVTGDFKAHNYISFSKLRALDILMPYKYCKLTKWEF